MDEQSVRQAALKVNSKQECRYVTDRALKAGMIEKPKCCEACLLLTSKLDKHHEDYTKPFNVQWLCKKCHTLADKMVRGKQYPEGFGVLCNRPPFPKALYKQFNDLAQACGYVKKGKRWILLSRLFAYAEEHKSLFSSDSVL